MMQTPTNGSFDAASWRALKRLAAASFASSMHFAIASVDDDGAPRVTPIGSLLLTSIGRAFFFERFTSSLPHNAQRDGRICVLAVDSSKWRWLKALVTGRFTTAPAVRLTGRIVGSARPPTEDELRLWRRRVGLLRRLRGYELLWGRLDRVRDVEIDGILPVHLGKMYRAGPCRGLAACR